ncbi:hypothetical protein [Neisseria shayeganii]|uniref:Uncharacterized protein n=1 Tax=Neisseria shayeganii TaxID=607712 RepID=A0A7D7S956_9NEIS|nr:hypothetical protein [Neisseria shayeganii]QMT41291.1 hypothetical protein H3L94_04490 [Neisseria shayeganii]
MKILDKDYKMKVTPEQSRAVQEACFANDIVWNGDDSKTIIYTERPYLYIRACGTITCGAEGEEAFFDNAKLCPIEPESIIAMLNSKPKGHPHAELMAQYAEDAAETDKPWVWWEFFIAADEYGDDRWVTCNRPITWETQKQYRRKPDIIKIGKHEFPLPMQTAPTDGTRYWYVNQYSYGFKSDSMVWTSHNVDSNRLNAGMCHLTKDAAEQHADVLNAINRGDVE